jgi:hypothetical protein
MRNLQFRNMMLYAELAISKSVGRSWRKTKQRKNAKEPNAMAGLGLNVDGDGERLYAALTE